MAKYTIELREIVESGKRIFPYNYPFYDEKRREEFERNFIRHFYFREIGAETVDRFKLFLEDKLYTVLPYYNKLFAAAMVEYDLLNNYNLTETTTIKRENRGKSSGVSSSVGRTYDEQNAKTTTENEVLTENDSTATGDNYTTDNSSYGDHKTIVDEMNYTDSETSETSGTSESIKKYLDTPQGLVTLRDANYLTNVHHDNDTTGTESERRLTKNGQTDRSENLVGENNRSVTEKTSLVNDLNGKENSSGESETHFTGEQKNTADNNTRSETFGTNSETLETSRIGNIGVQTGADMMLKHVEVQKTLAKIELLFFSECEDLFMGVY